MMSLQKHTLLQESPSRTPVIAESRASHLLLPLFTCSVRKLLECLKNNAALMVFVFLLKLMESLRLLLRGGTLAAGKPHRCIPTLFQ